MSKRMSSQADFRRFWDGFNPLERNLILFLVHAAAPISLDALIALCDISAVQAVNVMETLKGQGIVREKRAVGRGVYFLNEGGFTRFARKQAADPEKRGVLEQIVAYYLEQGDDSEEGILTIAELYYRLGDPRAGVHHVREAAGILYRRGRREAAEAYYDHLLKGFGARGVTRETARDFVDTVLDKIALTVSTLPIREAVALLEEALEVAGRYHLTGRLIRVKIALAYKLQASGDDAAAARHMTALLELVAGVEDSGLRVSVTLAISDILSRKGRFREALERYEEIAGELDSHPHGEPDLIAVATLGNKYVLCGRIQRGMALLDRVAAMAEALNLPNVLLHVEMMRLYSWLEMRKRESVKSTLARIYALLDSARQDHAAVGINFAEAYLRYAAGEYPAAYAHHRKGVAAAADAGIETLAWGWGLEYLMGMEQAGLPEAAAALDVETERLLSIDHIYRKGVALRCRALRKMARQASPGEVLADLDEGEAFLEGAGAGVEIARTRLARGRLFVKTGAVEKARACFDGVFAFLDTLDHSLFPEDLLAMMPLEASAGVLAGRVVALNRALEARPDVGHYLGAVLQVAMEFAGASRGVFLNIDQNRFRTMASRNFPTDLLVEDRFAACQRVLLAGAANQRDIVIPGGDEEINRAFREAGLGAVMGVPVALEGGAAGYLLLGGQAGTGGPVARLLPFLRLIGSQAALGLALVRARRRIETLETRRESRGTSSPRGAVGPEPLSMIAGRSEAIQKVKAQVRQVAGTDSTVLLLGETGVGKELVARAIHRLGGRAPGPFLPVSIAALPRELAASELFGHERGAFTGAHLQNKGRFELAHGGTIFLDEVGELSVPLQVKLLRVLQEGVFERLGSSRPIHSDFRVVAATNKDLVAAVAAGEFREDLYYRLNVFPIHIPPLRLRRGDISLLARYFIDHYARKMDRDLGVSKTELKKLEAYHWPGNVRELKHFIERAVILCDGGELVFSLPDPVPGTGGASPQGLGSMAAMEKAHIEAVLAATGGRVKGAGGAAAILEMKSSTLYYRMKKLGVRHRAG